MSHSEGHDACLLDVRDELAATSRLVTALWLAAQAPHLPDADRRALTELAGLCRDRLEGCLAALDNLLKPSSSPSAPPSPARRR